MALNYKQQHITFQERTKIIDVPKIPHSEKEKSIKNLLKKNLLKKGIIVKRDREKGDFISTVFPWEKKTKY